MSQKFLNSVKTRIFYEFLKLALFTARPSIRENGTSDVIPGHCQRRSSNLFCVWDRVLRVSFSSKELYLTQQKFEYSNALIMSSSDSSYDSSSDSEAAEVEVEYDLEVEGSSNNNNTT